MSLTEGMSMLDGMAYSCLQVLSDHPVKSEPQALLYTLALLVAVYFSYSIVTKESLN